MSLSILLYAFALIVLIFAVFAIIDLIILILHSELNVVSVLVTLFFLAGFSFSLIFSFAKLSTIDWSAPLMNFGGGASSPLF